MLGYLSVDTELLIASITFNPQSNDDTLILDAIDEFAAVRAAVLQLKSAELQRGVHDVSLPERSPGPKVAVGLAGVCI